MRLSTTDVLIIAAVSIGFASIGCEADVPDGELVVESLLGDQVRVGGGTVAAAAPGTAMEVPAGQWAVEIEVDGEWSEPIDVTVEPEETTEVDIPWENLPVQHHEEIEVLALSDEEIENADMDVEEVRAGEHRVIDDELAEMFTEYHRGDETPAGQPLVIEQARAVSAGQGLRLEAGDRIYAVDSQPVDDLEPLLDAYDAASFQDEVRSVSLLRDGQKWRLDYTPTATAELFDDVEQLDLGDRSESDSKTKEIIGAD